MSRRDRLALLSLAATLGCGGPAKTPGDSNPSADPDTHGSALHTGGDTDSPSTDTAVETGGHDTDTGGGEETDTGDSDPCGSRDWYADADGDGYGDPATSVESCDDLEGWVWNSRDCDDTRADVYPGALEICMDGVVNDCDDVDGADAIMACAGSGPFTLDAADAKLIGEAAFDGTGGSVAAARDVDGDGWDDLLVGAYPDEGDQDHVYLIMGPVSGDVSLSGASAKISADKAYAFGPTNGGAGDLDADGFADLLLPAKGEQSAVVFYGALSDTSSLTEADALLYSDEEDGTGGSVTGPGDVDGDGLWDLLIGAAKVEGTGDGAATDACAYEDTPDWPGQYTGAVWFFLGPVSGSVNVEEADARIYGESPDDYAGRRVAHAGDLDGDGLDDLYLSASGFCAGGGAAYVVLGPVSGDATLSDADARLTAYWIGDWVGESLSGAGDTDGDGTPDLLVGDPDKDRSSTVTLAGVVYLFLGPSLGTHDVTEAYATLGGPDGAYAGQSLSSAGDLDADGYDDLLIGAHGEEAGGRRAGAAYILYGPVSGSHELEDADRVVIGAAYDYAGESVAGVGDVDADGRADVLIGASGDDDGGTSAGAAYLLLGGGDLLSGDGAI